MSRLHVVGRKPESDWPVIFFTLIGGLVTVLAVTAYSVLVYGWVLTILWGWFIIPTFKQPALSLPVALGMSLLIRFVSRVDTSDLQKAKLEKGEAWGRYVGLLSAPFLVLFFGWLIHLFA